MGPVRNPQEPDTKWRAAVVVVDGDTEVELLVRSEAHSRHETPDPDIVARIVEDAAGARGDIALNQLRQPTAGVVLEHHKRR